MRNLVECTGVSPILSLEPKTQSQVIELTRSQYSVVKNGVVYSPFYCIGLSCRAPLPLFVLLFSSFFLSSFITKFPIWSCPCGYDQVNLFYSIVSSSCMLRASHLLRRRWPQSYNWISSRSLLSFLELGPQISVLRTAKCNALLFKGNISCF